MITRASVSDHGELDIVEGFADVLRAVAANLQADRGRQLRLEIRQQAADVVGDFDGVAARLAHDHQVDGALARRSW